MNAGSDSPDVPVTPDDVERAAERIDGYVRRTPVIEHGGLWLKLELLQHTGSFKPRGAFNRMLSEEVPPAGVIAASGGNHGAAVAFAASRLGVAAEVMIPSTSPTLKRRLIERYGAKAVVVEGLYDDAQRVAETQQARTGALMLHPFDHPATVAGQGTMARELEAQLDAIDTLVVASGGGGVTQRGCATGCAWSAWNRRRHSACAPHSEPAHRSTSGSPASLRIRWAPSRSAPCRGRSCGATSTKRSS
jgi:threonine dehydratase